jgi:hypothetical protein
MKDISYLFSVGNFIGRSGIFDETCKEFEVLQFLQSIVIDFSDA